MLKWVFFDDLVHEGVNWIWIEFSGYCLYAKVESMFCKNNKFIGQFDTHSMCQGIWCLQQFVAEHFLYSCLLGLLAPVAGGLST